MSDAIRIALAANALLTTLGRQPLYEVPTLQEPEWRLQQKWLSLATAKALLQFASTQHTGSISMV
jgi:hypothetical protein